MWWMIRIFGAGYFPALAHRERTREKALEMAAKVRQTWPQATIFICDPFGHAVEYEEDADPAHTETTH